MNENQVEMQISFNPDIADAAAERRTYNEGFVFSRVAKADRQVSKDKDDLDVSPNYFMLVATMIPQGDPDSPGSDVGRGQKVYQCLPFEPPHWEEAFENGDLDEGTISKWRQNLKIFAETTHQFLRALIPDEIPDVPRRIGNAWYYEGSEIEKEEVQEYKAQALRAAGEYAQNIWNNGAEMLEDTGCFHQIMFEEQNGTKSDWPSFKSFWPEVPTRNGQLVEIMTGNDIMGGGIEIAAKPAKKKAAKKKSKTKSRKRN